ncbi:hypothetical protein K501DRAFT_330614 [Backusella circina FSU 941]|nr:hypothetical protein K501DRAFT_330614 [Backusella circina FSU 941]
MDHLAIAVWTYEEIIQPFRKGNEDTGALVMYRLLFSRVYFSYAASRIRLQTLYNHASYAEIEMFQNVKKIEGKCCDQMGDRTITTSLTYGTFKKPKQRRSIKERPREGAPSYNPTKIEGYQNCGKGIKTVERKSKLWKGNLNYGKKKNQNCGKRKMNQNCGKGI